MLDTLISSKTRIKLLLKLFLNSSNKGYLRGLEEEFGENSNAIRLELNRFVGAGLILSEQVGNKIIYRANTAHPLFTNIQQIVLKHIGIDTIIQKIISQIGEVDKVFLAGSLARGIDNGILDLVLVGKPNLAFLVELIERVEGMINRKIRYVVYKADEFEAVSNSEQRLLVWERE